MGKHAAIRYTPGSMAVQVTSLADFHVTSVTASVVKKVTKRMMEVTKSLQR